jgi:hypothetical protein
MIRKINILLSALNQSMYRPYWKAWKNKKLTQNDFRLKSDNDYISFEDWLDQMEINIDNEIVSFKNSRCFL